METPNKTYLARPQVSPISVMQDPARDAATLELESRVANVHKELRQYLFNPVSSKPVNNAVGLISYIHHSPSIFIHGVKELEDALVVALKGLVDTYIEKYKTILHKENKKVNARRKKGPFEILTGLKPMTTQPTGLLAARQKIKGVISYLGTKLTENWLKKNLGSYPNYRRIVLLTHLENTDDLHDDLHDYLHRELLEEPPALEELSYDEYSKGFR